jgi:hypothetical protein
VKGWVKKQKEKEMTPGRSSCHGKGRPFWCIGVPTFDVASTFDLENLSAVNVSTA